MSLIKQIVFLIITILIISTSIYSQIQQNEDELINSRKAELINSGVTIKLKSSKIQIRKFNSLNGKPTGIGSPVLSIPIQIINSTNHPISTNLKHEWYGGAVILSDLFIAVQTNGSNDKKRIYWEVEPGFQIGYIEYFNSLVVLNPGETKTIDVRLNWRGTGSEPLDGDPLIDEKHPHHQYLVKFLLFFKNDNSKEYLVTKALRIKLKNSLINAKN